MKKIIALAVIALAVAIPYFVLDGETMTLDDRTRASLPGSFVPLSDGVTHYELAGPENGPVVVLVHGYTVPQFLWDPTFAALVQAGFRVLRYDMYGRGFSDRPAVVNDPDLFDRQLAELLSALKIPGPVDLAGISLGGAVCATFTALHPDRVRRLVLLAPFGYPQKLGFLAELIKVPYLGEYMMAVAGDKVLLGRLPKNFYRLPPDYARFKEQYLEMAKYKGYKKAFLSTMRHFMNVDFTTTFEAVGRQHHPVLLVWGRRDGVVPFATSEKVIKAIPGL
ncbi:MAG: alpha/beta hydrolase, partial [Thermodesulfobacteriota bacterium]